MKHFLYKLFIFIFPIIVIIYPLDILMSNILKQTPEFAGEFEVWNDIYNSKISSDLAIYGSSRAWVHINPEIIKDSLGLSAYNFGVNGHNFWLQYLRHIEYIENNKSPNVIVHSVDVFTFQKRKGLFNMEQFLPYMLWDKKIKQYTSSYIGFNKADYYIPLIRYFKEPLAFKIVFEKLFTSQHDYSLRNNGFDSKEKNWNKDHAKARKRRKNYVAKPDSATLKLYNKFLQECQQNKTKVIIVYTPEYIDGQKFVTNRKKIIDLIKGFAEKYNLEFLNYSNNKICFNKDYFYNASHLNAKGANHFSSILSKDLKELNITKKQFSTNDTQ